MKKQFPFWCISILFTFFNVQSYCQINPYSKIPIDSSVKVGRLSNGLTYYIQKNGKPENRIELRLVVNAGSVLEDDDQRGLAHFMEHMNFNGTKHFPKNQLVDYLQTIGVKFGADLNAYTSFDETVYILPISSDNPEILEKGFTVLEDWAFNNSFDQQQIERERGVILEESRLGKGANERMNSPSLIRLLNGSKYSQRRPIGVDSITKTFNPAALERFYRQWYRPDLMAVIAVGNIEPDEIEKKIKAHFGPYKNPLNEIPRPSNIEIPKRTSSEGMVITDPESSFASLEVYNYFRPVKKIVTWSDYRETIDENILFSLINGRYEAVTRMETPPFASAHVNLSQVVRGQEALHSYAKLGTKHIGTAVDELVSLTENVRKNGISTSELDRFKIWYANRNETTFQERDKVPSSNLVQEYISNFLNESPIPGIENRYKYIKEWLPTISVDEINTLATNLLGGVNSFSLIRAPESMMSKLPDSKELAKEVIAAADAQPRSFHINAAPANIIDIAPLSGKIIKEEQNIRLGTTNLSLSNGITITIKSTNFKNSEILMDSWRQGGWHRFNIEDKENAENAASFIRVMGLKSFSPLELSQYLNGKTVNIHPYMNADEEGIEGNSNINDFETLLQLTYLSITSPRKDADLFESIIGRDKSQLGFSLKNPTTYFNDTVSRVIYQNNPWGIRARNDLYYNKLKLRKMFSIYNEVYKNSYGMHFTFTGNIDIDKARPLIEKYIASLPSSPMEFKSKDVGLRPVKGIITAEVKRGKEEKSVIRLIFNGETTYSVENDMAFKALMDILNIQIIERLRQQMNGIYSGGFSGGISRRPYTNYTLSAYIPCGPEHVKDLNKALMEIIMSDKENGIEQRTLDKVKEHWRKLNSSQLQSNNYWLHFLTNSWIDGNDPEGILNYDKQIDELSLADVRKAAIEYLDLNNYVSMVLNPETAKKN